MALVLMAILTIVGATSLQVAGVDQRVATHNMRHMVIFNAASAGAEHARYELENNDPSSEGWDTADTGNLFVLKADAELNYEGITFPTNQGVYEVDAVFQKCGNPPPGYSTELGNQGYRSDYWNMESVATFEDATYTAVNPMRARVVTTLRKVKKDPCKIR
ncbi:MAG: hypothetical protein ACOZNI_20535 [Myxococcota bacterium]